jgi:spectinomycin phosphotransferase
MLTEPADLDRAELAAAVVRHWGLDELRLEYVPVGFGSHHWRAGEWFITVDDLAAGHQAYPDPESSFSALDRAYQTAAVLRHSAGLDFVVAPLPDSDGAVIRRLSDRYAITVFPYVEGESSEWGSYETNAERRTMCGILGRLHAATERLPAGLARIEDLVLPARAALEDALSDLQRPWTTGPFAEPTRRLLANSAAGVEHLLRDYDGLAGSARAGADAWVVTHGEPHRANVIRGPRCRRHLVDWDTALVAPRERDLHMVLGDDLTGWDEYVAVLPAELDETSLRLYRRWWELADITTFVHLFRQPHAHTEQTAASWRVLADNLGRLLHM